MLAAGIDHEEQPVAQVRDHEVVEDAAIRRGQQAVFLPAGLEDLHIGGGDAFQRRGGAFAHQFGLAHVGDVEQRRRGAALQVFLQDAGRVLHGHGIAREGHHAPAQFAVQRRQRRFEQGLVGIGHGASRRCAAIGVEVRGPPLSDDLRDSVAVLTAPYSVGAVASVPRAFQRPLPRAALLPERFRGPVAPSAGASPPLSPARDLRGSPS